MASGEVSVAGVQQVLAKVPDPETGRGILEMDQVSDLEVSPDRIALCLALTTHSAPLWDHVRTTLENRLRAEFPSVKRIDLRVKEHYRPPQKLGEIGLTAKSVIAVGSGKGGVGKSTVAAALALALNRAGCKAGLMDADVYGPSIPHLLGMEGRLEIVQPQGGASRPLIRPLLKNGMPVMSMAFLVPKEEAVVWRGPMLHGAITQFLRDTQWSALDYLIIDLPPGTGDIALTLSQLLPLTGSVVVCTPQDVALLDASKAIAMFRKVNIPVVGMVENMSGFICPECGTQFDIFGKGGARQRAEALDVPFLGEIPIHISLRQLGDEGRLGAIFDDPVLSPVIGRLAFQLAKTLADRVAAAPPMPKLPVL
jgi:ATP-binding protein involved in chromosome partitioning